MVTLFRFDGNYLPRYQGRIHCPTETLSVGDKRSQGHSAALRVPSGLSVESINLDSPIHGHLPLAVTEAVAFLQKHAFKTAQFGDVVRKDVWSVPVDAVREVIINALAHATWGAASSPVRVAFLDDRIEVDSPGGLMPGQTVQAMLDGVSMIRNPVIVRVFREMRLMEEWGSGIKGVVKSLADQGLGSPQFLELPNCLRAVVPIRNHSPRIAPEPGTTRGASEQVDEQVSEQVAPILRAALTPITRADLLDSVGLSNAYGNYQRHLVPLVEQGLLAMTIPGKPNSRLQRYQTTALGRDALDATE